MINTQTVFDISNDSDTLGDSVSFGLNPGQQVVFDHIINMELSDRLRLNAPGGCGKTYTLTKAIEYMIKFQNKNVIVVAPTHMARQVLLDKIDPEIRHLVESKTVASLLGRFGFRGNSGDTLFSRPKPPNVGDADIIILDECSMLSAKDLQALLACEIPVVFSGDLKQLPVVRQKKAEWETIPVIDLTVQMRQADGGKIHQLAEKLREGVYIPTQDRDHDPDSGLHVLDNMTEAMLDMAEKIAGNMDRSWEFRILTYKNMDVARYNNLIRELILDTHAHNAFVPGEYILLGETCSAGYNAEILKIKNIISSEPNPVYDHLTDYMIEFENGHTLRVLSPADYILMEGIKTELKNKLKEARERKNSAAVAEYCGRIDYLDYNWTKINYTYATTVHKSQGQTIPNVYVDTYSLSRASNKRALLYVAFSRASENLFTVSV